MSPEGLASARLPEHPGPYRFAVTFRDEAEATSALLFPGAEAGADARTVQVRAGDFEEGYRKSLRLLALAGVAARETTLRAVLAASPEGDAWRAKMAEFGDQRFIGAATAPPPAAPATGRARFFGAR